MCWSIVSIFFLLNFISSPCDLCSAEFSGGTWHEKLCVVSVLVGDEFAVSTHKKVTFSSIFTRESVTLELKLIFFKDWVLHPSNPHIFFISLWLRSLLVSEIKFNDMKVALQALSNITTILGSGTHMYCWWRNELCFISCWVFLVALFLSQRTKEKI